MVAPTTGTGIEQHPDIVALRDRYDRAGGSVFAQMVEGLGFLAAVYLAISPWVVGFNGVAVLTANNLITGIAFAALTLSFASAFGRTHGVAWVAPLIGAWTVVAPWLTVGDLAHTRTIWNNVIVGGVMAIVGLGAIGAMAMSRRR